MRVQIQTPESQRSPLDSWKSKQKETEPHISRYCIQNSSDKSIRPIGAESNERDGKAEGKKKSEEKNETVGQRGSGESWIA